MLRAACWCGVAALVAACGGGGAPAAATAQPAVPLAQPAPPPQPPTSAWLRGEATPDPQVKAAVFFAGRLFAVGVSGVYSAAVAADGLPGPWTRAGDSPASPNDVTTASLFQPDPTHAFLFLSTEEPAPFAHPTTGVL